MGPKILERAKGINSNLYQVTCWIWYKVTSRPTSSTAWGLRFANWVPRCWILRVFMQGLSIAWFEGCRCKHQIHFRLNSFQLDRKRHMQQSWLRRVPIRMKIFFAFVHSTYIRIRSISRSGMAMPGLFVPSGSDPRFTSLNFLRVGLTGGIRYLCFNVGSIWIRRGPVYSFVQTVWRTS